MNFEAFILIGGRSSRFGSDKALFDLNGETLADRAARIAETALGPAQTTFVAANNGQFPSFTERRVISDIYPGRGPIGAIHAALANASAEWIFVLACDLPLVSSDLIRHLATLTAGDDGVVIPVQRESRWQPLCAFYRVAHCRKAFEMAARMDGQLPSLLSIIEPLVPRIVGFDEYQSLPNADKLLQNINTPDDLPDIPAV